MFNPITCSIDSKWMVLYLALKGGFIFSRFVFEQQNIDTCVFFILVYCRRWLSGYTDISDLLFSLRLSLANYRVFFPSFLILVSPLIDLLNYLCSRLNRPVSSIYSIVYLITFLSPSNVHVLIPCAPTFLLNLSLSSSYNSQFNRK
jgi:hypothetical protein